MGRGRGMGGRVGVREKLVTRHGGSETGTGIEWYVARLYVSIFILLSVPGMQCITE